MAGNGSMFLFIALGIMTIIGIATLALAGATLGTLNKRHDNLQEQVNQLSNQLSDIANKIPTTTLSTTAMTTPAENGTTTDISTSSHSTQNDLMTIS